MEPLLCFLSLKAPSLIWKCISLFQKTSHKLCSPSLVLVFQLKLQLNSHRPVKHPSIHLNSFEPTPAAWNCTPPLLIRATLNKASLQLNRLTGPGCLCSHTLFVLGKHTSIRYYQSCQVALYSFTYWAWAPVGAKLVLVASHILCWVGVKVFK